MSIGGHSWFEKSPIRGWSQADGGGSIRVLRITIGTDRVFAVLFVTTVDRAVGPVPGPVLETEHQARAGGRVLFFDSGPHARA